MASHVEGSTHRKKKAWKKPIPKLTPESHRNQDGQTSVTSLAPRGINVAEFAESRALEIQNMVEAMTEADRTSRKRFFQQLPRHMRRRAMSHNVKRLPVRLREEAQVDIDKFPKLNEVKKKSRRHRRRPKNLLAEYMRRQRQHIWLETHIWHAKRMKMVDAWGYRLAEHPNDKGFRAVHRAVTNSCTIQDISYYGCIEISGPQAQIMEAMTHVTNQDAGPTIKSRQHLSGSREGLVVLYQVNKYPHEAVGPISFLWRQNHPPDSQIETSGDINPPSAKKQRVDEGDSYQPDEQLSFSQLWLWVHPACFSEAFDVIVEACKLVCLTVVKKDMPVDPRKPQEKQDISEALPDLTTISGESRLQTHVISDGRTNEKVHKHHICSNGEDTDEVLTVTSLRHDLVRFCLTGPQSHAILNSALVLHKSDEHQNNAMTNRKEIGQNPSDDLSFVKGQGTNPKWWQTYISENNKKKELWSSLKQISSPAVLQPGCVVSLMVMDPRLNMPHKKTSIDLAVKEDQSTCNAGDADVSCDAPSLTRLLVQWPEGLAISPLWMSDIRTVVKETKISEHELNKKRSELLVAGTEPDLGDEASRIPIMLLQQVASNCASRSHNSPQGYGAGWDIILPSGWAMPFWMALIYRGARAVGLKESRACALEKCEPCFPGDFPDTAAGRAHNESLRVEGEEKYAKYPPAKRPNYHKLGTACPFSCPFDHLVREWEKCDTDSQSRSGEAAANSSCEPDNALSNAVSEASFHIKPPFPCVLRSKSILGHLRHACSARKSERGSKIQSGDSSPNRSLTDTSEHSHSLVCVSLRMLNRSAPLPCAAIVIPTLDDLRTFNKNKNFSGPVEPLHKGSWEQFSKNNLIGCCTREIIGYVTAGDYSLARGGGAGLGFCIVRGLLKALALVEENSEFVVLVRNTNTQQYRFASLDVV